MENRKLFSNQQIVAVLIGLIVGTFACFLVAYCGTDDTETLQKVENLGAQYRATIGEDREIVSGIFERLGVPLWEGAQGLGHRLPNFLSQKTQSPSIFLNSILAAENLALLRLLTATLIGLTLLNLSVVSWGGRFTLVRLMVMDSALLGTLFLYSILNDWFFQADQYWGAVLIIGGLTHVETVKGGLFKSGGSWIPFFSLIFGFSFYLMGHISWWSSLLLLLPISGALQFVKSLRFAAFIQLVLLILVVLCLALLQLFELRSETWPSALNDYQTQTSVFDFFQDESSKVYRFQPLMAFVAAGFQPVLRVFDEAGSRTEFFNFIAVIFLTIAKIKRFFGEQAHKKLLDNSLRTICIVLLAMMSSGVIARSNVPIVNQLASIHAWQLAHLLLAVVTISTFILLGHLKLDKSLLKPWPRNCVKALIAVVFLMSISHPTIMYFKDFEKSPNSIFRDSQVNDVARTEIKKLGLTGGQRFIILKEQTSEASYLLLGERNGLRFNLQLARAGYPTIEEIPYGRSVGTLATPKEKFRSAFNPTVENCTPKVLDFLGVSTIWVEQSGDTKSANCADSLKRYFDISDTYKPERQTELGGFIVRPGSFTSFSHSQDPGLSDTTACPQFEKDCLFGLAQTKFQAIGGSPFQLCEDNCLFTYQWRAPAGAKYMLIPSNYDKTFIVRDKFSGVELKTTNFRGLLSVEILSGYTAGVFEASINPDLLMWARIASTYLQTIVFLGCLLAMLLCGIRALKNFDRQAKAGNRD